MSESRGEETTSYTYDGNYNRLTKSVTGQPTEEYSYDDADRLLSVASSAGTKGFTYDNDGRCTGELWNSTVVKTYSWDPDGRMTSATGSWGTRSYAYNGFGARVAETGGAGRQWFRRNPTVTSPVLKDGINRYTPGTSLRALAGGTSTFQHGGLKSLDAQSDTSQAVSGTKTYDAFGATASSTGSWQGQSGFGGGFGYQPDSDTGLQLLGHRYHDPTTGRFLSRDPAKDGPNWYAYCLNDPVNGVDPDGRIIETILDIIGLGFDIGDVAQDPSNKWAWMGLGWSVLSIAFPCIPGSWVARIAKLFKRGEKAVEVVEDAGHAGRTIDGLAGPMPPVSSPPKSRGKAPIGEDGFEIELHHPNGEPDGDLIPMTRTDHRLGENFAKNHSNTGGAPSNIDRREFSKKNKGNLGELVGHSHGVTNECKRERNRHHCAS